MEKTEPASVSDQEQIIAGVKNGSINWTCIECAKEFRVKNPYNGLATAHHGACDICKQMKTVMPAKKIFGYYRML